MKYEDCIKFITNKNNFRISLGLDRIKSALEILGNPQDKLKYIHVAGTNGKGSVCTIIESILREAGYKTGLYTSPHIFEYTERIKINGTEISKEKFAAYFNKIHNIRIHLTEFEILTIIMFLYFEEENVDIVILETGLGGNYDATNVIKQNICSVITHIDLDHTDILGDTKEKIAKEKAGIIKKNCPIITNMNFNAIKNKAQEENSKLIYVNSDISFKYKEALSLKGIHQTENLKLAVTVISELFKSIQEDTILNALKKVKNPARFQYIKTKNLIVDASHNPNGISALRENLDYYFPNEQRRFIFGCLRTKNYKEMMDILFREGDEIYFNEFNYPKACTYKELISACKFTSKKYEQQTFNPDKLNIICGSFYMIGNMKYLQEIIY